MTGRQEKMSEAELLSLLESKPWEEDSREQDEHHAREGGAGVFPHRL